MCSYTIQRVNIIIIFYRDGSDGSGGPTKLLRQGLLEGDMFLGACVASALVKLALRYPSVNLTNESMLIMAGILNYGKSGMCFI